MFDDADRFLKIAVGLGVLAAGGGVGYHYGINLPEIERQKIERADQAERDRRQSALEIKNELFQKENKRKRRYEACLADASINYVDSWNSACKLDGKGKECSLLVSSAERLNKRVASAKQVCLEEYKSGI